MADYRRIPENNELTTETIRGTFNELKRDMRDLIIEKQVEAPTTGNLKMPVFMVRDMSSTFLTMDKALLYVGDNSTFQKRITWILAIQWIAFSFMVNSMAYFFRTPSFSCRIPLTQIYFACSHNTACALPREYYRVDPPSSSGQISIAEQFGMYCDHGDKIYLVEGLFFLGGFFSGYLLSYISERVGRRPVILSVLTLSIIFMFLCAWAPSFNIFAICYFFTGCFMFGYETTVYIYISQISAVRFKTISINMLTMVWAGTPMFLALLGLISSWRYSFLLFAVIWLCTLPFAYFCFLQSPRFLLSKKQIFAKISVTNRRPPYQFKLMQEIDIENQSYLRLGERMFSKITEWAAVRQYNYLDLFRFNSVKKATFLLMFLWTFRFFIYYATNLALQSVLQSGFWLTLAISTSSFSQVMGTFGIPIITFLFSHRWSTMQIIRKCLLGLTVLCALLLLMPIDGQCKKFQYYDKICLSILGMVVAVNFIKFTNSIFFSALISFSSEVYPTVVRSLGYGFTLTFGRMTTFAVPFYISYMRSEMQKYNALCWFGVVAFIGFLFCLLMPAASTPMLTTIPQEDEQLRMQRTNRDIQMTILSEGMKNFGREVITPITPDNKPSDI